MLAAFLAWLIPHPALASRYEQMFPGSVTAGDITLERKGISQLTVGYLFRVYVAAFYQAASSGPADVLADEPRHLEIEYLRRVSRDALVNAADDMLAKKFTPAEMDSVQEAIHAINALYQDVRPGDRYSLTYVPGTGTELRLNGERKGIIPGAEFARIYFSIWLGDKHPYQDFRDRLVGLRP